MTQTQLEIIKAIRSKEFPPVTPGENRSIKLQEIYDAFPERREEIADEIRNWSDVNLVGDGSDNVIEIPAKYFEEL